MRLLYFLVLLSVSLIGTQADAQTTDVRSPDHPAMPKLTPNSPEASAFNRYGEYPVSMFTGVPDISIPLYEIKSGSITIPVSLSYHASGNKVNDFAPWSGLGWTISAGGRISRKVLGKDDQAFPRYIKSEIDSRKPEDHKYLRQIATASDDWDSEPDVYIYNFPGKSGKYIFGNEPEYKPVMIPYCGVRVAGINSPNILTDEFGSVYSFGQADHPTTEYPGKTGTDPISGWMLTKIVNAGRTDSVELSYNSAGYGILGKDYVDYVQVDDRLVYGCTPQWTKGIFGPFSYSITTYGDELVPSQIIASEAIVKFFLSSTDRVDRPGFKSIDRIEIYAINDPVTPFRTIKFHLGYFDNGATKRLRLDSLKILDKAGQVAERYKFDYNSNLHLPDIDSKSKDYWGYFNGVSNNLLLPRMTISFINDNFTSTSNLAIGSNVPNGREPDPYFMQAYILNKITYPTGGYTTFEYETNRYVYNQSYKYAGGLRIRKIKNYAENGIANVKTYEYGTNGSGRLNVFFNDFYYQTPEIITRGDWCKCQETQYKRSRTFTSAPCTDLNPFDGSPVVYSTVTEYIGDESNNTGKTVYTFTDDPDTRQSCGPAIFYTMCRSFRRNLPESKTVYRNDAGAYRKVSYLHNKYFAFTAEYSYQGIKVAQVKQYECMVQPHYVDDFTYCYVPVYFGDNLLTSTTEYQYDVTDESRYVAKSTLYTYNNERYTQLTSVTTTSSSGDKYTTSIKYPNDFDVFPYSEMVSKNVIGIPVQKTELLNFKDTLYSRRDYFRKYYSKFFAPEYIKDKTGDKPFETRIRYHGYDTKGNLLSASLEEDVKTTYLWGYNKVYPVAKVENATLQEVESVFGGSVPDLLGGGLSAAQSKALREGLPKALVTTYNYKPLVGLESQTDPNGLVTHYDYDDYGRLIRIRNDDENILKAIEYNYKKLP